MDKYIFDESNGLWYERQGDYYIPCLILPVEEERPIGLWGQRHLRYIKEHHKARYTSLLSNGKLNSYLVQLIKLVHRLSQAKSKDDLQKVLNNPFKDISEDYVYESVATNTAARLISDVSDILSGRNSNGKHQERN